MFVLWSVLACVEEVPPDFQAEGCVESQAPEAEVESIAGRLLPDEGEGRILTEVVVTTADWIVTFSDGKLTSDSEHCDCTSESFSFVQLESTTEDKSLQGVVAGGSVCFRNTSTCGEVELIGAGVQGNPTFQFTGTGALECEED